MNKKEKPIRKINNYDYIKNSLWLIIRLNWIMGDYLMTDLKSKLYHEDDLVSLVFSLSGPEKRIFKQYSSTAKRGETSLNLELFEGIELAGESFFENLEKKTEYLTLKRDLPAAKYKLEKAILKAMRVGYLEDSPSKHLANEIQDANFLFQKGLFANCRKVLRRAQRKAESDENWYSQLAILDLWAQLMHVFPNKEAEGRAEELLARRMVILDNARLEEEVTAMFRFVFQLSKIRRINLSGSMILGLNRVESRIIEISANAPTGKVTCFLLSCTAGMIRLIKKESQKAFDEFRKVSGLLAELPVNHPCFIEFYRIGATNYLNSCLAFGQWEEFRESLEVFRKSSRGKGLDALRFAQVLYYLELVYCLNQGVFVRGTEIARRIVGWANKNGRLIDKEMLIIQYYNSALLLFFSGEFAESRNFLNRVINFEHPDMRTDLRQFSEILSLVVYFEQGDYDYLDHRIAYLKRRLSKKISPDALERASIDFLYSMNQATNWKVEQSLLSNFSELLREKIEDSNEVFELGCREMWIWVEAKKSKKRISDYYSSLIHGE